MKLFTNMATASPTVKTQKPRSRRMLKLALLTSLAAAGLLYGSNLACQKSAASRVFSHIDEVPFNDVGLVLGTAKTVKNGRLNLHFSQRIRAAAALYHAGKVRHLIVSGDNHIASYDEPTDMREALAAAGVPASAITCDYAGFRTLDSVLRAKSVFGQTKFTIITEDFHCPRAVWIARRHGLDAIAFAAPDVSRLAWSLRMKFRESLARAWCAIDLYMLNRSPKFPGPPEPLVLTAAN